MGERQQGRKQWRVCPLRAARSARLPTEGPEPTLRFREGSQSSRGVSAYFFGVLSRNSRWRADYAAETGGMQQWFALGKSRTRTREGLTKTMSAGNGGTDLGWQAPGRVASEIGLWEKRSGADRADNPCEAVERCRPNEVHRYSKLVCCPGSHERYCSAIFANSVSSVLAHSATAGSTLDRKGPNRALRLSSASAEDTE